MKINIFLNLNTMLSILLFLIALGVLVSIHELGHFIAAKSFKVYCSDFSIGFGPKILKLKRKTGETTFSLGIVPFGGYVSMYGDENDDNDAIVDVPKERSLAGIKRYKRIIIMSAGIIMNFVLAYILFFISASCFPQTIVNSFYEVDKNQTSLTVHAENPEFGNNDEFLTKAFIYENGNFVSATKDTINQGNVIYYLSKEPFSVNGDSETGDKYVATFNYQLSSLKETDVSKNIVLYKADLENVVDGYTMIKIEDGKAIKYEHSNNDTFNFDIYYAHAKSNVAITNPSEAENLTYETEIDDEGNEKIKKYSASLSLKSENGEFSPIGISFSKYEYWYGWKSFEVAGQYWAKSTTVIAEALFNLFVGQGWDQLGGPIAIFSQTTQILENNPFYMYIRTWGMISVNLALFNLLPFPGLDGWQILVEIIEGSVNGIKRIGYKAKKDKNKNENNNSGENVDLNNHEVVSITSNSNLNIGNSEDDSYKEWKISPKVKAIVSYVGLGILFLFMAFVIVKDIIGLF